MFPLSTVLKLRWKTYTTYCGVIEKLFDFARSQHYRLEINNFTAKGLGDFLGDELLGVETIR
jgi:hypothetical protein